LLSDTNGLRCVWKASSAGGHARVQSQAAVDVQSRAKIDAALAPVTIAFWTLRIRDVASAGALDFESR
jgi:hypothetical protein